MKDKSDSFSLALAATALILFLILISSAAAAAPLKVTETQITTSGSASNPDIYEGKIVWQDTRNGGNDVYMYDISTNTETRVTTSGSAVDPAIYGNMIVWSDGRNGNEGDIYMYDLSTKQETRITTSGSSFYPDIYGNKIVWSGGGIYLYDISTKNVTTIAQDWSDGDEFASFGRYNSNPVIYGNWIAYSGNEYTDIFNDYCNYLYDLSTKNETVIASSGSEVLSFPDICNDEIVYSGVGYRESGEAGEYVYMYHISTQKQTKITNSGSATGPSIYGNKIVWRDWRNGWDHIELYMYDLSANTETQITTSGSASNPRIYEDRVVWQDTRNGSSDIYMASLSYPLLPVASFSTNVSNGYAPLTVQFTDFSEGATEWNWNFGDGANSIEQNPIHTYSAAGVYTVNLTVSNANGTNSTSASITVSAKPVLPVFPGYTNPPTDPNHDGLYEDVNGNGMMDFDDVVAYYDNMDWIGENIQVAFFDYNKNSLIDFDDVVKLYDML